MPKTSKVTLARSSVSGQFVTMATAKRNPRETEVEHYKKPAPPPAKKGK